MRLCDATEGGRGVEKVRDEDFDSHYRYVSANETIRASPTGTLMAIRLYIRCGKTRAVDQQGGERRDKKEVATGRSGGRDRHKARESIIIIAPVNPGRARCNPR